MNFYKKISDLVQNEEWQNLRVKLLGQWKSNPEWCCSKLSEYIGNIENASIDKIKILMNYLTGSGFRMRKIDHKCIDDLRLKLSNEIKRRKANGNWPKGEINA